jgi:hypothetical protein
MVPAGLPAGQDTQNLAIQCAGGKAQACSQLATLARTSPNSNVRFNAVDWVKDQTLLAEIARTDSDSTVRACAVQKLNDQAALAEIEGGSGLQGAGSCRLLRGCRRRGQEL